MMPLSLKLRNYTPRKQTFLSIVMVFMIEEGMLLDISVVNLPGNRKLVSLEAVEDHAKFRFPDVQVFICFDRHEECRN